MEEKNRSEQKKNVKFRIRFGHIVVAAVALGAVWWFNNYTLRTTETTYSSAKVTERFRIALLSDLHVHSQGIRGEAVLKRINSADPDIVFVLGDMYTRGSSREEMDMAVEAVADIVGAGYPTFFVSGDHDTDKNYIESIGEAGAYVMNYENCYTEVKGNRIQIIGIDNVYYSSTFDLSREFIIDESCFSILLAHIPNYDKFSEFGADLTLCADMHGGMAQLPFGMGPVIDPSTMNWFPEIRGLGQVFDKGWFPYIGGSMYITSGIGDHPYPVRFNNRPEIVVMDILPQ